MFTWQIMSWLFNSYEDVPKWGQNDPFVLHKIYLLQTIIITSICLLPLFIVENF